MNKDNKIKMLNRIVNYFRSKEIIPSKEEEDRVWNNIMSDIHRSKRKTVSFRRIQYTFWTMGAAAMFAGTMWILHTLVYEDRSPNMLSIYNAMNKEVDIDTDDIILMAEDKQMVDVENNVTIDYSKSEKAIQLGEKTLEKPQKTKFHQLIVPTGKHTRLILADGSTLHVNAGTKVIYPDKFEKNHREIFVDGEIYIDVVKNEKAPFVVSTTSCDIQVLGTAFNVHAYSQDKSSEIVLVRGSVKLTDKQDRELMLKPDELALVCENKIKGKKQVDASDYVSWTQGLLKLDATPLSSVFRRLERYYGVKISYDDEVGKLKMYGNLDLECPVNEVLRRLGYTAPISIIVNNDNYIISKK